jgi:hypothetical protein
LGRSAVAKETLFAVQPKRESLQYWVCLPLGVGFLMANGVWMAWMWIPESQIAPLDRLPYTI